MLRFEPRAVIDSSPLPGLEKWLSDLLVIRGIDTPEKAERFLNPQLSDLNDPFLLQDMDRIVSLLRTAIAGRKRIMVWGDYDADGICAASILTETLREEGADVSWRLPSRHAEGYGLNESAVREIAPDYDLLITVDCGISNQAEVALARELGLTVIVTDHHTLPPVLPEADAVTNPLLGDYPCPYLCGAGVALKICQAMQGMAGVEKRLDLAAIATVADVVPLLEENRIIVREGLKRIVSSPRPGLQALLRSAAVSMPLHSDHLAFRLGPRLNAAGRLESAALAAELLMTQDPARAEALAEHLEQLNARRQQLERTTTAEADAQAKQRPDFDSARCLIVSGEDWNPGLIGLTAGRLCERYHKPAIALSFSGDTATGSCRSIPGVNIVEILRACEDLLVRFGGHAQAAGLTVQRNQLEPFRARLDRVIRDTCNPACFEPMKEYDLAVPFRQWTPETLDRLACLEPTGCGNPAPVFLLKDVSVQSMRRVGKDLSHLQMSLLSDGVFLKGIGFSLGAAADAGLRRIDLLYRPILNEFRGNISVEAQVSALRPAAAKS